MDLRNRDESVYSAVRTGALNIAVVEPGQSANQDRLRQVLEALLTYKQL
jgi:hypothetical protein